MSQDGPTFRIVRGTPTDEELAAVVVVLSSMARAPVAPPTAPAASAWSAPGRSVRQPVRPGPGAWRMSGRG